VGDARLRCKRRAAPGTIAAELRRRGDVAALAHGGVMSLGAILLVVLILILIGVLPTWPYSSSWGYAPGGIVGAIVLVLVVLWALGQV
jgi:hypothetical protein